MSRNVLAPKPLKSEPISPKAAEYQAAIDSGKEREYLIARGEHPEDVDWFLQEMERRKREKKP